MPKDVIASTAPKRKLCRRFHLLKHDRCFIGRWNRKFTLWRMVSQESKYGLRNRKSREEAKVILQRNPETFCTQVLNYIIKVGNVDRDDQ
jgi:hypothetical protein